jgi:hypothetical protein
MGREAIGFVMKGSALAEWREWYFPLLSRQILISQSAIVNRLREKE